MRARGVDEGTRARVPLTVVTSLADAWPCNEATLTSRLPGLGGVGEGPLEEQPLWAEHGSVNTGFHFPAHSTVASGTSLAQRC